MYQRIRRRMRSEEEIKELLVRQDAWVNKEEVSTLDIPAWSYYSTLLSTAV
jgi:hypothetical protein